MKKDIKKRLFEKINYINKKYKLNEAKIFRNKSIEDDGSTANPNPTYDEAFPPLLDWLSNTFGSELAQKAKSQFKFRHMWNYFNEIVIYTYVNEITGNLLRLDSHGIPYYIKWREVPRDSYGSASIPDFHKNIKVAQEVGEVPYSASFKAVYDGLERERGTPLDDPQDLMDRNIACGFKKSKNVPEEEWGEIINLNMTDPESWKKFKNLIGCRILDKSDPSDWSKLAKKINTGNLTTKDIDRIFNNKNIDPNMN